MLETAGEIDLALDLSFQGSPFDVQETGGQVHGLQAGGQLIAPGLGSEGEAAGIDAPGGRTQFQAGLETEVDSAGVHRRDLGSVQTAALQGEDAGLRQKIGGSLYLRP